MQDEEQQPVTLQVVVDEGRKPSGHPKKPANQQPNSAQADADRKQFVKDLQHIRSTVDWLAKDIEKLNAAQARVLDIVQATGAVSSGSAKQHGDRLDAVMKAIAAGQETTAKALEYTQQVLRMCAANPKELERLRKIAAATDPQFAQVATKSGDKLGWWVAFGFGAAAMVAFAVVMLM